MLNLLRHELITYFKSKSQAIYIYSFIVSVLMIAPFALEANSADLQLLAPVSLWLALTCATGLAAQSIFRRDHEQGRLEYYQLLPTPLEGVVLAKWLAFYLFLLLPLLAALPVAVLLYDLPASHFLRLVIGLVAGAAALSILVTGVAALTTGLEKAGAVISLLMLPVSIPIVIFGAAYMREASILWSPNLIFLLGFSAFMLPLICFAGATSIRQSN